MCLLAISCTFLEGNGTPGYINMFLNIFFYLESRKMGVNFTPKIKTNF